MIPPEILLQGYATGIFPMADGKKGKIQWYSADPRGIIDINDFHVPQRLLRYIKSYKKNPSFEILFDNSFSDVLENCAIRPKDQGMWISDEIIESYINLHKVGFAHSVEVHVENKLVAGLYGVALRGAFFGESMFNFKEYPNTSKIALYFLIEHLIKNQFALLDIQMITSTTEQFGAKLIKKSEYLVLLQKALERNCQF